MRRRRRRDRQRLYRRRRLGAASIGLVLFIFGIVAIANTAHHRRQAAEPQRHKSTPAAAEKRAVAARERRREVAAIDRVLSYTPFFRLGLPRRREVALTFDDGPGPYTPQVLAVLRRTRTPATFFVIGSMLEYFSDSLRAERRAGHSIGNHTESHLAMGGLSGAEQISQLDEQAAKVAAAGGPTQRLFRPPYGSYDPTTLRLLRERKMLMVLWSVDTNDYEDPGVEAIVQSALRGAEPGAIILMHDAGGDRSQTVAALPKIIRGLRRRGLRPVSVPRLLLDDPPPRGQVLPERLGGS